MLRTLRRVLGSLVLNLVYAPNKCGAISVLGLDLFRKQDERWDVTLSDPVTAVQSRAAVFYPTL